jgi:hypothetical protein
MLRQIKEGVYERIGIGKMDGKPETVADYWNEDKMLKGIGFWEPFAPLKQEWKEFRRC